MVEVIHAAFGARPALDPPSTADAETVASVTESLRRGGGVYAQVNGRPAGAILVQPGAAPGVATFNRVSVHPDFQRHGIASAMVVEAEGLAAGPATGPSSCWPGRSWPSWSSSGGTGASGSTTPCRTG